MPAHISRPGASLADWLSYLEKLHPKSIDLGLERVKEVYKRLGIKLDCFRIVVAGTNGKGSTCAMLESIMLAAGYKVGKYTSPHLLRFNERICINGRMAADAEIISQFERIEAARGAISLSYFEFATLAAFLLFDQIGLDVVVLEVGLGGRLDAVNVVDNDCAIVTSIDLDHTDWLGTTREQIALEKAHVFRPAKPAICADPVAPQSLVDYAQHIGADLWRAGIDFNFSGDRQQWAYGGRQQRRNALAYPALRGANQLLNAAAVLAALEAVRDRFAITQQEVRQGLLNLNLPGRLQILPGLPATVLDVAHNPHAVAALGQNLDAMGHFPHTFAVVGMFNDKAIPEALTRMVNRVDHWLCVDTTGPRGTKADSLAATLRQLYVDQPSKDEFMDSVVELERPSQKPGVRPAVRASAPRKEIQIQTFDGPQSAYEYARQHATDNDRIVVFGSFSVVGPVLEILDQEGRDVLG